MSKTTEHLLQIAAVMVMIFFGYSFSERTVIALIQSSQRASLAEQRVAACEAVRE